ncbi:MAG: hypothetical protein Q9220_005800 [cf. Caloplaca sp. 1 TL-2023]
MSKKFKSQASSSRAVSGAFGTPDSSFGKTGGGGFGAISASPLSYVYEPPELSAISDPNVIVAFKNVQKKDSTTKAKALEDLQKYISAVQTGGDFEDAILDAWTKVFPRTSIDTARRVRQLAYLVQGNIAHKSGKKFVRYMRYVVGAWLSGSFDGDKSVSRAAQESVKEVFPTDDKVQGVWRVYLGSIIQYCNDAVFKETMLTLSDERTVNPEDASAKYARLIASSLAVIQYILGNVPEDVLSKEDSALQEFLGRTELWKFSSYPDSPIRRQVYKLLGSTMSKKPGILDIGAISSCVLTSSLSINQTGSALEYSRILVHLTEKYSGVWTNLYTGTGKKSATKKLCQFLAKGSQGGSPLFWDTIGALLPKIPISVILPQEDIDSQRIALVEAFRDGASNREESRANQNAAWKAYLDLIRRLLSSSDVNTDQLIGSAVMPLLVQYISPSRETSIWTVSGLQHALIAEILSTALTSRQAFIDRWRELSSALVEEIQISLPEQSKDFVKSQDAVSAKASRWHNVRAALDNIETPPEVRIVLRETLTAEIESAIALIKTRNGKPYGAASLLETAFPLESKLMSSQVHLNELVVEFVTNDVPHLLLSPSGPHLVRLMPHLRNVLDVDASYRTNLKSTMKAPESPAQIKVLQDLLASPCLQSIYQDQEVVTNLTSLLEKATTGDNSRDDLLKTAAANPRIPPRLLQELLAHIMENLSPEGQHTSALNDLETIVKENRGALKANEASFGSAALLARLIALTESSDEVVSQKAKSISDHLRADDSIDPFHRHKTVLEILSRGTETASSDALSIPSLVDLASKTLTECDDRNRSALSTEILPNESRWHALLQPFFAVNPNPALAIMNSLGSAVYMLDPARPQQSIVYDQAGHSAALRLFWFTSHLIQTTDIFERGPADRQACIFRYLAIVLQLASDNLSIQSPNSLWQEQEPEAEEEIAEIINQTQKVVARWVVEGSSTSFVSTALAQLLHNSSGESAFSYYSTRAYIALLADINEVQMDAKQELIIGDLKTARQSADTLKAAAMLSSVQKPATLTKTFNEYLAGLTGGDLLNSSRSLSDLIVLNSILEREEIMDSLPSIPKQRLVFFVQHVSRLLLEVTVTDALFDYNTSSTATKIVCCISSMQALYHLLPVLSETYGSFWEDVIEVLIKLWLTEEVITDKQIPILHSSLRLYSRLRISSSRDSNDDLLDALNDRKASITKGMINVLHTLQDPPDDRHQPRKIVNELLAREISHRRDSVDPEIILDLFPVLASPSEPLQDSAYELLHSQIPKSQENVSLEKALSKDYVAKLPEELLSLIFEAPTPSTVADMDFQRFIPSPLRIYLLSWLLIFDHWRGASDAVKGDYIKEVKEGSYLDSLLNVSSDFLITSRTRPLDASKFDIDTYTASIEEMPEKDAHWLMVHLYYLALKHLPTLSKAWWRDSTSRQTQLSVESWTEKYISPLITSSELATVAAWAPSQASESDQPLTVKVSQSTHEITASIPIDEQSMSLAITLPPSYPLSRATVSGLHRVGVTEQKWRSWIITTQGVINFSDIGGGNQLIDGLTAWRKNVTATLKGQTECAICYSVVSADRQLPNKRCGTCKNLFHGSCLFKWFKSSNSSSCPLCRNQFSYA